MATHDDEIDITVDGQHLAGTLVSPALLIPGVLFVHGWGGSQEKYLARARQIAALGCVCLRLTCAVMPKPSPSTKPLHARTTCVTSSPPMTCLRASGLSTRSRSPWWVAAMELIWPRS